MYINQETESGIRSAIRFALDLAERAKIEEALRKSEENYLTIKFSELRPKFG
jgi:hypothetical protein